MSASSHALAGGSDSAPRASLPLGATLYLAGTVALAAGLALPLVRDLSLELPGWPTFLLLTAAAAVAQLFTVRSQRNYSYHTTGVFIVPAILLLPGALVALMPLLQRLPDWLRRNSPWTLQTFNVAAYTVAVLVARAGVEATRMAGGDGPLELALSGLVAASLFVGVQTLISAPMIMLVRRCSLADTGVFAIQGISTEVVLAALGVGVAFLWAENPWLVPFALAPLLVVHRSLSVPLLEAEARVDAKTGLFNARHFATALEGEFGRAQRFARPLAVVMADLDLLREVNNTYGHLAGDAVLREVAAVLRAELRHYDVPARFGGEEFAIILPETGAEEAAEIAERIRQAVAQRRIAVDAAPEPISVTISIGIAVYPVDADHQTELVHQADVAVYRAKLQGRNRVVRAGTDIPVRILETPAVAPAEAPQLEDAPLPRLAAGNPLLWFLGLGGIAAGVAGFAFGSNRDIVGMLAIVGIVALVQALADGPSQDTGSVAAVGVISAVALFGPRIGLAVALAACAVEWGRTRTARSRFAFETGMLTLGALAAAAVFAVRPDAIDREAGLLLAGMVAGGVYFLFVAALPAALGAIASHSPLAEAWRPALSWMLLQHGSAGLLAGVVAIAFAPAGLWTLVLLTVPLLLARATQDRQAARTGRAAAELAQSVATLTARCDVLERANGALREHTTALMEALASRIDDRETEGHSREVQRLALAVGTRLGLSQAELEMLAHAALFHDIGKLAVPDAVLLKHGALTDAEWTLLREHADEGARLVEELAFLQDAVPAIRHHHERYDGRGYPDGLAGEEIPLGARIIHVAEATVAMLQGGGSGNGANSPVIAELQRCAATQFCPRCVEAVAQLAADGMLEGVRRPGASQLVA